MTNHDIVEKAVESRWLTVLARGSSAILTPILIGLVVWNFSTLDRTQIALTDVMARVIILERNDSLREARARQITERRDDQINEIVQRLARVEEQGTAMVAALNRLTDRLDREQRRGDLLTPNELKAAQK